MPSAFKTQPIRTDIGPGKLFDDPSADGSFNDAYAPEFVPTSTAPLTR